MLIQLSPDEEQLRQLVREFARDRVAPYAAERDKRGTDPSDILRELGELGVMGMTVPEEYGGLGLDRRRLVIAIEELAYADASVAGVFSGHYLGMEGFKLFGSDEIKNRYLVPMAAGKCRAAFALTEADAGSDISNMKSRAVWHGDRWILNGTKLFISSAKEADVLILFAKTDPARGIKGISAFAVPSNSPGISYSAPLEKMGARGEQAYEMALVDVILPADSLIGVLGEGAKVALGVLNGSRIDSAAGANGIAMRALQLAVDYASLRRQFGQPIREFQSIQTMLGQMDARVAAGRTLTYAAASYTDENAWDFRRAASIAKYSASENAFFAVDLAVQIFGGYGYMKESEIERLYRDVRLRRIFEGTSQIQLLTIAKALYKSHDEGRSVL